MMKKCVRLVFIIAFLIIMVTGCWNNKDLTELAITSAIALDMTDEGNIELTVQIINPSAIKNSENGGSGKDKAFSVVTIEGKTIFDAVRNMIAKISRKIFFSHVQLIVLNEGIARQDIHDITDLFERDHETRRRSDVIIARGIQAKEILRMESNMEKIPSVHLVESLTASESSAKVRKITLLEILKQFANKGQGIVIGTLMSVDARGANQEMKLEDLKLEGSAVVKVHKLAGYLNVSETRGFLFADDKVKSTIINISSPINTEKNVSIEIIRSQGKISGEVKDGEPVLGIEIKAEGNIGEQQEHQQLTQEENIKAIEREVVEKISDEIRAVVKKSQNDYECDIFGFVNEIHKNHYSEWKEMVDDWDKIYSRTPVNIKVEFKLRRVGLIEKPSGEG